MEARRVVSLCTSFAAGHFLFRLVFCDKGAKADFEKKTAARLEGRPKVPIATYAVPLVAGEPNNCVPEVVTKPEDKDDVQWLLDATIRLEGQEMPGVGNF